MRNYVASLVVLAGLIMLMSCAPSRQEGTAAGLYKDAEAKAIAFESYDKVMELWPVEFEEDWVETEYGTTHIIVSGPDGAKPVFLIPGSYADATMWYPNVEVLAEQYRVYSLDLIVFGGKSEPSAKPVSGVDDYVAWFSALKDHYGYSTVSVAGLSYGSWLSLTLAREIPDFISAVVLLDPAGSFAEMDGGMAWRGLWTFALFQNRAKYARFYNWMGGDYSGPQAEIMIEHLLDVTEYGSVSVFEIPQPGIYSPEELTMVTMPVLVMASGKPILYKNPREFAAAAARALPHAEIEIVPGAGHFLNAEKADQVNARMIRFFSENYR